MKLLLLIPLFFLGWLGHGLAAQEELQQEELAIASSADEQLGRISAKLQLTEDQLPEVRLLLEEFLEQNQINPATTPEEKRSRRRAIRGRMAKLLTPEQQALMRQKGGKARQAQRPEKQQKHWLDALIDEVATPLLEKRQRRKTGG